MQTLGGDRYNRRLARSRPIGRPPSSREPFDASVVVREMSYVSGASLCVTRAYVEAVGLLDESYFLYGEEIDWVTRARGKFALAYAHDSVVYHKEGRTTGASRDGARRTALADYFMIRSRLRFTWMHAPAALPTVVLA